MHIFFSLTLSVFESIFVFFSPHNLTHLLNRAIFFTGKKNKTKHSKSYIHEGNLNLGDTPERKVKLGDVKKKQREEKCLSKGRVMSESAGKSDIFVIGCCMKTGE